MRLMSRDLSCSYVTGQEGTEFMLTEAVEADRTSSTLSFCATLGDRVEEDLSWNHATSIQYYVDDRNYPEPTLLAVTRKLIGPETGRPATTNEMVRNVRLFKAEAYDGKEWKTAWSSEDEEGLPQAIQFSVEMVTGSNTTTQRVTKVYLAAGNMIEK
jgi:hypothetical protein